MTEEPKENLEEKEAQEKPEEKEKVGKQKHERLKEESFLESKSKEKFKDFKRSLIQKGKHQFDKMRKDKFLGGTKGRRGG